MIFATQAFGQEVEAGDDASDLDKDGGREGRRGERKEYNVVSEETKRIQEIYKNKALGTARPVDHTQMPQPRCTEPSIGSHNGGKKGGREGGKERGR